MSKIISDSTITYVCVYYLDKRGYTDCYMVKYNPEYSRRWNLRRARKLIARETCVDTVTRCYCVHF